MRWRPYHLRIVTDDVDIVSVWSIREVIALQKPSSECKQPEKNRWQRIILLHQITFNSESNKAFRFMSDDEGIPRSACVWIAHVLEILAQILRAPLMKTKTNEDQQTIDHSFIRVSLQSRGLLSVFAKDDHRSKKSVDGERDIFFPRISRIYTEQLTQILNTHLRRFVFLTKRNQTLNNSWIAYNKIILSLHKSLYINWFPTCTLNNRLFALIFHIKDFTLFDMQRCGNWFFFPEIFFTLTMEPCALTRRYFDRKRHSWVSNVL